MTVEGRGLPSRDFFGQEELGDTVKAHQIDCLDLQKNPVGLEVSHVMYPILFFRVLIS